MTEYEKVLSIKEEELDNQPMAGEEVRESYNALYGMFDRYINALQDEAFYWGYITAMRRNH